MKMKQFEIKEIECDAIRKTYGVDRLLAKKLSAANFNDETIQDILSKDISLKDSHAECIVKIKERILQAKENKEKIFVGGDYDADGICSTAIMKKTLDYLGIENGFYIPNRFKEGYGLSPKTVEMVKEKGYDLIITVDNGVKAVDAIAKAKKLGIEIIITDHHLIDEELDVMLVHPTLMEEEFQYLSGAGVALEISRTLIGENGELIALAAVAHIGDVMPLYKETRKIVQRGLEEIKKGASKPMLALIDSHREINATTLGFEVVPKLNSVGRLNEYANVNTVPLFLCSTNDRDILHYASDITHLNQMRKELSKKQLLEAEEILHKEDEFLVVYKEDFLEGICGITASRLSNTYGKPTLVLTKGEEGIKGSGRSIPGLNLVDFFSDFKEIIHLGGHEMAAGLTIEENQLEHFYEGIQKKYASVDKTKLNQTSIAIALDPTEVNLEGIKELEDIEPIPKELNEIPFALCNFKIIDTFENDKMIKYQLEHEECPLEAIMFKWKMTSIIKEPVVLIGDLSINAWNGKEIAQLEIEEMR